MKQLLLTCLAIFFVLSPEMKSRKCAHFDTLGVLAYGAEGAVSARPIQPPSTQTSGVRKYHT